ncbi:MAG: MupG family TIM beta-alpha barrel fold protein [Bacilli bacterium]
MIKIGFSIYTGLKDYSKENNLKYLKKCVDKGCEILFTSAHINEASNNYQELTDLVTTASENNLKVIIDVSKPMMEKFVVPPKTYAIRLDYGFTKQEIVEFSKNHKHKVELNASTIDERRFQELIDLGLDTTNIRVSFNFYPKPYTGHDIDFVKQRIDYYHSFNIPVLVFIPSHVGFRPPLYQGLPSVEKHRQMSTNLAIEELKSLGVDEIAFGDAYVSDEELEILAKHKCEHLLLPFTFVKGGEKFIDHINMEFSVRPDYNNLMLRMTSSRGVNSIEQFNTVERKPGYVTIDNNGFLRYKGEINIILTDLPKDERVNVIGKVELTKSIVEALKAGQKFVLEV